MLECSGRSAGGKNGGQDKCSLQQQNYAVLKSLTHNPHITNEVRQNVYFENFY